MKTDTPLQHVVIENNGSLAQISFIIEMDKPICQGLAVTATTLFGKKGIGLPFMLCLINADWSSISFN